MAQAAALGAMAMRCLWMSMPKGSWIDDTSLRSTAEALAQAGVSIMTNAPGDHAFPPILALRQAGVQVFSGNDNIQDAWWPFGNGYMLQRVMLVAYRSGFRSDEELLIALDMATHAAAAF